MLTEAQIKRNEERIATLDPICQPSARAIIADLVARGIDAIVEFGRRDMAVQARLYAARKPGQRVAPPGHSMHEFGLAIDVGFLVDNGTKLDPNGDDYTALGEVGKAHGWIWGGDWHNPDSDHLSYCLPDATEPKAISRLRAAAGITA